MDLSIQEAAQLLDESEDIVYRWIREGSLCAHRVRHQYRLNRVELQEWAAMTGHRVSPRLFEGGPGENPKLSAALECGGIYPNVTGRTREAVLEAVSRLPGIPSDTDRDMLYQLLLARGRFAPTGIDRGIALPHPRDPLVLRLKEPRVLLCFPTPPLDLRVPERKPVHALFLLLTPSVRAHLQTLAMLAHVLHDPALLQLLAETREADAILGRVRDLERASS
jgi:nitrogen PTS system EIIA component